MAIGLKRNKYGGGSIVPVNTPISDVLGTYSGGNTIRTSSIYVPAIQSGQVLRLTGKNNQTITYNYTIKVEFSNDGITWSTVYTSGNIPFPTSGVSTTIDVSMSSWIGTRGYFRVSAPGQSSQSISITFAMLGTF